MDPDVVAGDEWWEKEWRLLDGIDDVVGVDALVGVWGWLPLLL